jgi:ankyrin repeat protein
MTDKEINKSILKWSILFKEKDLPKIKRRVEAGSLPINWIDGNGIECSYLPNALFIAAREQPEFFNSGKANKETILHNQKHWDIVKYLLSKNASLCEKDKTRSGNLSRYAVSQPSILEELLKRGDDPNGFIIDNGDQFYTYNELHNPMPYQQTAMSFALRVQPAKKRYKVIKILLKYGASATNLDTSSTDAPYIPIISEGMYQQNTSLKWRLKIIKLLLRYGAKIKVLTYTKKGKKICNYQALFFGKKARERNEAEMLALWKKYNSDDSYKDCIANNSSL